MSEEDLRVRFDWASSDSPREWVENYRQKLPENEQKRFDAVLHGTYRALPADAATQVGEPLLRHLLRTAQMVADLDLLPDAVLATIAAPFAHYVDNWREKLAEAAGKNVVALVGGIDEVQKLTAFVKVDSLDTPEERQRQAENMRKMLLAMVSDIRVVLIKLAMRTRTMQYLGRVPDNEQKRAIAKETLEIFAPLANRLGVWQLKWELEDLGFRYQQPEQYREIAAQLEGKRTERMEYIAHFSEILRGHLQAAGIRCNIAGRPKHIYSIYRKMQKKHLKFNELYDIRAVRVLVDTVPDCYAVLGVVHGVWQSIPGEFDDYISHPKANDYRSLHTVVVGPENKGVEIQIRTHEMHQFAEFGVAAHWRYKEGGASDAQYEQKIAWLRQLLDWRETMAASDEEDLAAAFKTELFRDTIYVLTPQGRVISLPEGATSIDFAYALHTDIGNRCRGAKVNGQITPLSTPLANGQRVEILTAKDGTPSPDWLHNGWVKSSKAANKIRAFIRAQNIDSVRGHGKELVEKVLGRQAAEIGVQKLKESFSFKELEDFYAAVGQGEISVRALEKASGSLKPAGKPLTAENIVQRSRKGQQDRNGILVDGEHGLLTVLAKCCKPAPPDEITGFVTAGRGISIHRQNCPSLAHLAETFPEKILRASWAQQCQDNLFAVDIELTARDRNGLLFDVSEIFSRNKINVTGVQTQTKDHTATMRFTIETRRVDELPRVLDDLSRIKSVLYARRM